MPAQQLRADKICLSARIQLVCILFFFVSDIASFCLSQVSSDIPCYLNPLFRHNKVVFIVSQQHLPSFLFPLSSFFLLPPFHLLCSSLWFPINWTRSYLGFSISSVPASLYLQFTDLPPSCAVFSISCLHVIFFSLLFLKDSTLSRPPPAISIHLKQFHSLLLTRLVNSDAWSYYNIWNVF